MTTNPNRDRRISENGLAVIKRWEGFSAKAYKDLVGVWTIGYGITDPSHAFEGNTITREFAEQLLIQHVAQDEISCRQLIKVPLSQPQWDAVVSLCYNIGPGAFARSTLLRKLNQSDFTGAYAEFPRWNRAGGKVVQGLVNRRKEEAGMFLTGTTYTKDERFDAEESKPHKSSEPTSNVVPDAVPDNTQVQKVAGGVAATAGVASQVSQVEVVRDALAPLAGLSQFVSYLFVGVSLLAIWYMLSKRDK
jgi:lysozyme